MSIKVKTWIRKALQDLRDFALTALAIGGVQVLIALAVWPIVFKNHPLGLAMALSLVGFGCWALSFIMSLTDRRRQRFGNMSPTGLPVPPADEPEDHSILEHMQEQAQRAGCGFLLLASSLLPLGIALVLRLRHDLRAGLTLSDIFPPLQ